MGSRSDVSNSPMPGPSRETDQPVLLVSADCHAGPPVAHYRDYLDPPYLEEYDGYLRARAEWRSEQNRSMGLPEDGELIHALFGEEMIDDYQSQDAVSVGGPTGVWDSDRRLTDLEGEGIVAEVIFPDLQNSNEPPWGGAFPFPYTDKAHRWAGAKAYNRWLAEFCQLLPGRRAGLAIIFGYDVDEAVEAVRWARRHGLAGILLPTGDAELPSYHDRRYDPLWGACIDDGMPVTVHPGGTPWEGFGLEAMWVTKVEFQWWARRPLWQIIFGGVFERFPDLKLVLTEQGVEWIPAMLDRLEEQYTSPFERGITDHLTKSPWEYWASNCYVGASFMSKPECMIRERIGVDRIMWGSDYPHIEGTWPHSDEALRESLSGCNDSEIRLMLGVTAAGVYEFNVEHLRTIAKQVGPHLADLQSPEREPVVSYDAVDYAMGRVSGREMKRRILKSAAS